MPSFERERIHGESKLNPWRDGRRVLKTILKERFLTTEAPEDLDAWRPHFVELGEELVPTPATA